ncbi:MAG: GNAT family N-acetyltransferase [Blastocatellia bacterium]
MIIRTETTGDMVAIRNINEQAFGRPAEANLVDALRRNGKVTLSLVAEDDGRIVGHILFSPVTIELSDDHFAGVGLAPVAVLPERQNRGIGSLLVKRGLERCREAGYQFAVVLGHPEYYPRFGFVPASRFNIKCEYDVADEVFMAMELQDGALGNCAGVVKYQVEFNEVE